MLEFPTFQFHEADLVRLLFIVPVLTGLIAFSIHRKTLLLRKLACAQTLTHLTAQRSQSRQVLKASLLIAAVVLLILVLMRPQGEPRMTDIHEASREVIFLLDVSKSMLARDLKPNRLERAKLTIEDALKIFSGERVALVIFAGEVILKCPLTLDYNFFRAALRHVAVRDVSVGGTNIGDAVRYVTTQIFRKEEAASRNLILITDGGDNTSLPVPAAQEAGERGITIFTVGLGNPDGVRIPDPDHEGQFITYEGSQVRSRLDEDILRQIALATPHGMYIPARTGSLDLGSLYSQLMRRIDSDSLKKGQALVWQEWYQAFLLPVILLLVIEGVIRERRRIQV